MNQDVHPSSGGLKFCRDCTIYVAKTKALISWGVIAVFVFAYTQSRVSHDAAHIYFIQGSAIYSFFATILVFYLIDWFSHDAAHIYFIREGAIYSCFATICVSFV